jgi:hypothetical protein
MKRMLSIATGLCLWTIMASQTPAQCPLPEKSITVTGIGVVKGQADRAQVIWLVTKGPDVSKPPTEGDQIPLPVTQKELQTIVNILVRSSGLKPTAIKQQAVIGTDESDPTLSGIPGSGVIQFAFDRPTPEKLDRLLKEAQAAVDDQNLNITPFRAIFSIENCQSLERLAYEKAMQDSVWRVQAIAKAAKVTIGETSTIAEEFYNSFSQQTCGQNAFDKGLLDGGGNSSEISVRKALMVTYPVVQP